MLIALLTDFGTRDPYVAAMKGVLVSRTSVPILDLTHEIAPFDVLEAAWFLRCVVDFWPKGTIFVCVVDPGVGTSRKIVAVEVEGKVFLAPDNGLLTFVTGSRHQESRIHELSNESFFLPNGSTTFHGRDRFAPVAAALANGTGLDDLGPSLESLVTLPYMPPSYGDVVLGTIVAIDRFGNAITDIEASRVPFGSFSLRTGEVVIDRLERTYTGDGPFLVRGSTGRIEISVTGGSAAERLHLRRLQRVELRPETV
jgi:S-adenosyl-L-methionine hydrolase (adenosine-forming)